MKKFKYKKVAYSVERVGYGVYKITAKYSRGWKTAISTESLMYDLIDDECPRKQGLAVKHFFNLIKNQNRWH